MTHCTMSKEHIQMCDGISAAHQKGQAFSVTVTLSQCLDSPVVRTPAWHVVDLRIIPVREPLEVFQINYISVDDIAINKMC